MTALVLLFAVPAFAVFNEKDLGQTLSVLRQELKAEYGKMAGSSERLTKSNDMQHHQMVNMMKKCNELALMLYSQKQDFTFDMTYALKSVTREYEDFNKRRMPFDDIVSRMDLEIDRYSRLVESLRRLPPQLHDVYDLPDSLQYHNDTLNFDLPAGFEDECIDPEHHHHLDSFELDEQGQIDRDSCLFYAASLLKMYSDIKDKIVTDNDYYEDTADRLKESYDYAQARYSVLQKRIFVDGQNNYFKVLGNFRRQWQSAMREVRGKYDSQFYVDENGIPVKSQWQGPMVFGFLAFVFGFLVIAALLAFLVVKVVKRYVKHMRRDSFKARERCLIYLATSFIFACALMVALIFVPSQNFFSVAAKLVLAFAWLLVAILMSLAIRLNDDQAKAGMHMYVPIVVAGLFVIVFRIIFIPNSLINVILPPLMLVFFIWQAIACKKYKNTVESGDAALGWITLAVFAVTTVVVWIGYVFIGVMVLIWWLFQVACIETITAISELLDRYDKKKLVVDLEKYYGIKKASMSKAKEGEYLSVTWIYDLVRMTVLPVITTFSIPFCLKMSADVFDFTGTFRQLYYSPIVALYDAAAKPILHVSVFKIVLVISLFFVFKYLVYVTKALYKDLRTMSIKRHSGANSLKLNQVNFSLANHVISFIIWAIFIITVIILWKIPVGAISVVFAGLATGLGLAMKDILNNFIYGIQLMSGRLRVGDWVECDGVRGKVTAISYQSTQIETLEGAVMSFLNTDLFNRNFKNLTKNNAYEFVKVVVGVNYGADVEHVREVLLDALEVMKTEDKYGRDIVDPKRGIYIVFEDFGDSSVNIAVKQFVLVAERSAYIAKAKEVIYKALNDNGIEIPFPQRDVHIK